MAIYNNDVDPNVKQWDEEQHQHNLKTNPSYREWWQANKTSYMFKEYMQRFYTTSYPKELRHGQAAFNYVYATEPDIANQLRASAVDPFYQDRLTEVFWLAVEKLYLEKYKTQ